MNFLRSVGVPGPPQASSHEIIRMLCGHRPRDTSALEALLPDRWVAAHPEHRLDQRVEESREAQARRRRKRAASRIATAS
ncbi:MAG: hypothetical protein WCJ35_20720 [Planctomycetota bacterium]